MYKSCNKIKLLGLFSLVKLGKWFTFGFNTKVYQKYKYYFNFHNPLWWNKVPNSYWQSVNSTIISLLIFFSSRQKLFANSRKSIGLDKTFSMSWHCDNFLPQVKNDRCLGIFMHLTRSHHNAILRFVLFGVPKSTGRNRVGQIFENEKKKSTTFPHTF